MPTEIITPSTADLIKANAPLNVSNCCDAMVSAVPPASYKAASSSLMPGVDSVKASIAGAASVPNIFIAELVSIPAAAKVSSISARSFVAGLTSSMDTPMVSS